MRRLLHAALCGLLVLGTIAMVAPGGVTAELSPPDGQTAVKLDDVLQFGGSVPPGAEVTARLVGVDAGDAPLGSHDVSALVREDGGAVGGTVRLTCFYVPGCQGTTGAERRAALDAVAGFRLELTVADVSDTSDRVDFDTAPPTIVGYALTSPTTVVVRFTEDVVDPEGDAPADWGVAGTTVTSVDGVGDARTLTLLLPLDGDATPEVRYIPTPSPDPRVPNVPYVDGAANQLDAANRISDAADRVPPAVPSIDTVDGGTVTYESQDTAAPVRGNDATPTVGVSVDEGATVELFLDDGDGAFEVDQDTRVATGTGGPGGTAELVVSPSLTDGPHRFYARALDTAACDPNDPGAGSCPNASGRSPEAVYDLDTVAPTIGTVQASSSTISVPFTEQVSGADGAGQWRVDNGTGGAIEVTEVEGSGASRFLTYRGGTLEPGATLTWTAPASDPYVDEHGNRLVEATRPVGVAPLPILDLVATDGIEGDDGLLATPSSVEFVVRLSEPLVGADTVRLDYATVPGDDTDATADEDYTPASGSVVLTAMDGDESDPITVELVGDALDEFDEDVLLRVTGVSGAQVVGGGDSVTRAATIADDDDPARAALADGDDAMAVTEGEDATYTVELDVPSGKAVEVPWSTDLDGTASAADVPAQSGSVVVPAGGQRATFTVTTAGDAEVEGDETLSVDLGLPTNADLDTGRATSSTLTVVDDDVALPTLTVDGGTVAEDAAPLPFLTRPQLTYTFTLSAPATRQLSVGFTTDTAGDAAPGADFDETSGTVVFAQGEDTATATVAIVDDALDEFDETVAIVVTEPAGADLEGGGDALTVLGTVTDDDPPVEVSITGGGEVTEGEPAALEVVLDAVSGKDVTVSYATDDGGAGGATADVDYTSTSGTVTVPAGDTRGSVVVQTLDDAVVEGDETLDVRIALVTDQAATLGADTATIALVDDDELLAGDPVVSLSGTSVAEGDPALVALGPETTAELLVTLSGPADGPVELTYRTTDGTALAGDSADYEAADGATVTIADGDDRAIIPVGVHGDALDEFDETFTVTVTAVTGRAQLPAEPLTRTVEVLDDDRLPTIAFAEDSTTVTVGEGSGATFTVQLDAVSGKQVTVDWTTDHDGTASTADVAAQSGTVTVPAGAHEATFTVETAADEVDEPQEELRVRLRAPSQATLGPATATLRVEDGTINSPELTLTGHTVEEGDGGPLGVLAPPRATFTLRLSQVPESTVTVDYTTTDTGTAVAGEDHTATSGSVTFTEGTRTAEVTVDVLGDTLDEFDETVALSLRNVRGATLAGGGSTLTSTATITDDDPLVAASLGDDVEVAEGEPATVRISLDGASGKDVQLRLRTADGTATAGTDYRRVDRTVTIPAGETAATVTVPTLDDAADEPDETLTVALAVVGDDTATLGRATATITLVDDDVVATTPDANVVSLSGDAVAEGDGTPTTPGLSGPVAAAMQGGGVLAFELQLSRPADGDVVVSFETRDGTATAGEDYTAAAGTVTIPDGASSATVRVQVLADRLDEEDERMRLVLTGVSGDAQLPDATLARTGVITDDDPAPVLRVSDATVLEGDTATLTVSLDQVSGRDVSVAYDVVDGTAVAGSDLDDVSGTLTIPAGNSSATVDVSTTEDGSSEGLEQAELRLSSPTNAGLDDPRGTISIVDVVGGPGVVFLEDVTVTEQDTDITATVPVRLLQPTDSDTSVTWTSQQLTASPDQDYVAPGGEVVIPAGRTAGVIVVTIVGDDLVERTEDFLVVLTGSDAIITGSTGRVTIGDDDLPGDGDRGQGDGGEGDVGRDGAAGSGSGPDGDGDGVLGAVEGGPQLPVTGGGLGIAGAALLLAARRRRG